MKINSLIWEYDNIDMNILGVRTKNEKLGYFRLDLDQFISRKKKLSIEVLNRIVNEYDDAKKEAEKIIKLL